MQPSVQKHSCERELSFSRLGKIASMGHPTRSPESKNCILHTALRHSRGIRVTQTATRMSRKTYRNLITFPVGSAGRVSDNSSIHSSSFTYPRYLAGSESNPVAPVALLRETPCCCREPVHPDQRATAPASSRSTRYAPSQAPANSQTPPLIRKFSQRLRAAAALRGSAPSRDILCIVSRKHPCRASHRLPSRSSRANPIPAATSRAPTRSVQPHL